MRTSLVAILFCFGFIAGKAQAINYPLTSSTYEFSGLTKWRHNKILLLPQNDNNPYKEIFVIDSTELDSSIRDVRHKAKYSTLAFDDNGLSYIKGLTSFDGFEAVVAKADTLFFAIETNKENTSCYIVK